MSDLGTKFSSTDVRKLSEEILELLDDMEGLARALLKGSTNLQNNLQDEVANLAIDVSNEMLKAIGNAKKITLQSTENVREGALLGEEIESIARKEKERM